MNLFVYGTLQSQFTNPLSGLLGQNARLLGRAYTTGYLYSLGWYPGATHDPATRHRVWGEIYELHNELILTELDDYEGIRYRPDDDYARRDVPAWLADAHPETAPLRCQMYVFQQPTAGLTRIESGVFLPS